MALAAAACGYVKAGRWDDDPKNWQRAFNQSPPPSWHIVRSRLWRYPHFTYEGGFYFHVWTKRSDRSYIQPDYVRLTPEMAKLEGACEPRPSWFAPRPATEYEIYGASGTGNYRVFIDPNQTEIFFFDCQY